MQPISWNLQKTKKNKQVNPTIQQAMLTDTASLVSFSQDFGKILSSSPAAIFKPLTLESLQTVMHYGYTHHLPFTIRGNGLSQSGQSLAFKESAILSMGHFDRVFPGTDTTIWAEANASWSTVINATVQQNKLPFVVPYNCELSIAGVLSAGGVGASSFKYGSAGSQIAALEVITANGERREVQPQDPLFQACLGGQGRFGAITKACITLRPCLKNIRTFFLLYDNPEQWLSDLSLCETQVDFVEAFCSPAPQGAKLTEQGRTPFAYWFYALQISLEYEENLPHLPLVFSPWKIVHIQDEPISNFIFRHEGRFKNMKLTGLWDLAHPWYECFIDKTILLNHLPQLLNLLPLHYASVLQIVPITSSVPGFFMQPKCKETVAIMILAAGIPDLLVASCLETIKKLDLYLLPLGGKRYLSGFLGEDLSSDYWQRHFEEKYSAWVNLKKEYDAHHVLCSLLYKKD